METNTTRFTLAAVVLAHLGVAAVHGLAHARAPVPLGAVAMAFVFFVILLGPVAGLVYARWRPVAGALTVSATMTAALLFGLVNHFLLHGGDHVSNVAPDWRVLFGSTAVLLIFTEAAGAAAGLWCASRAPRRVS